jgi:formylglycine-generating enzyme required for sulfatase activity
MMFWWLVACGAGLWATPEVPTVPLCEGTSCAGEAPTKCGESITPGCFIEVGAGSVVRGAQSRDPAALGYDRLASADDGLPAEVRVGPFLIQATEATVHQGSTCVRLGMCPPGVADDAAAGDQSLPATHLDLASARALCQSLGGRLPTEAEWEFAAMGGGSRRFSWGQIPRCAVLPQHEVDRLLRHRLAMLERCPIIGTRVVPRLTTAQLERAAEAVNLLSPEAMDELCAKVASVDGTEAPATALAEMERALSAAADAPLPTCPLGEMSTVASEYTAHPWKMMWVSGNLAEWVDSGDGPLLKGGSFLSLDAGEWRISARAKSDVEVQTADVGVRCVREVYP